MTSRFPLVDATEYHAWELPTSQPSNSPRVSTPSCARTKLPILLATAGLVALALVALVEDSQAVTPPSPFTVWLADHREHVKSSLARTPSLALWQPPAENTSTHRCEWVVALMREDDGDLSPEDQRQKYKSQSTDANAFYRATAAIFWRDFVLHGWGNFDLEEVSGAAPNSLADHSPLQTKSTWTWITGDQHLSNFGAWRNRHGDVIFGVNDFDEGSVHDFQIDVWRLTVSIHNHALTNKLEKHQADELVMFFCDEYVRTLQEYVGNDKANTFEVDSEVATGKLREFLQGTNDQQSAHKQLKKFTTIDTKAGERRLSKTSSTSLEPVTDEVDEEVRRAFGALQYGATRQKIGWRSRAWSDDYFRVLDVAKRVGSGIGSYGVARYYVLLAGHDAYDELDVASDPQEAPPKADDVQAKRRDDAQAVVDENIPGGIILDVKFEPNTSAVAAVLNEHDTAWYRNLFVHDAQRAIEAQRRLTSYTDPFAGWVMIFGEAHTVRQRSPWKAGFDLGALENYNELAEYISQVAVITATSHARGTYAKSPAQFKEVIAAVLGKYPAHKAWGASVARVAEAYGKQVTADFECFRDWVEASFPKQQKGKADKPSKEEV